MGLVERLNTLPVGPGMLALGALGQAGFAIKAGDTIAYIDPYLSDAVGNRAIDIVVDPATIGHADVILCTHEHVDHTDVETIKPLAAASPDAPILASNQGRQILLDGGIAAERISVPVLGEPRQVGEMRITAVPAAHYEFETDDAGHSRWMGFVVEVDGVTLYHAGDTILFPELIEAIRPYAIDLALLPINGRDYFREQADIVGNMNPREVATFCKQFGPRVLIPTHNDLFAGNRVHPAELVLELERVAPRQRYHFLQPGEIYLFCG
jgi:L-ascorbate 6-phosphate lactonase